SVAIRTSVHSSSWSRKRSSDSVRAPSRSVMMQSALARGRSGAAPTPPAIARTLSPLENPFPNGPRMPIVFLGLSPKRAAVASPTFCTVMLLGDDRAMGISSTPGTQTMTNCPGENVNVLSRKNVRTCRVSFFTRTIATVSGTPSSMGAPHNLPGADPVLCIEVASNRLKYLHVIDHGTPDLHGICSRHHHLDDIVRGRDPATTDNRNFHRVIQLVHAPDCYRKDRPPRKPSEPVAQHRTAHTRRYPHGFYRVDRNDSAGPAGLGCFSDRGDIRHVRGEVYPRRHAGPAHRLRAGFNKYGVRTDRCPVSFGMGAREVQLKTGHFPGEPPGYFCK